MLRPALKLFDTQRTQRAQSHAPLLLSSGFGARFAG